MIPASVVVTFTDTLYAPSVTTSDFSISGTCAGVTLQSATVSGATVTLALNNTSGCALNKTVTITTDMTGIQDAALN